MDVSRRDKHVTNTERSLLVTRLLQKCALSPTRPDPTRIPPYPPAKGQGLLWSSPVVALPALHSGPTAREACNADRRHGC